MDKSTGLDLTMEQQFKLNCFKQDTKKIITQEDAIKLLVDLYTTMLVRENHYKVLFGSKFPL